MPSKKLEFPSKKNLKKYIFSHHIYHDFVSLFSVPEKQTTFNVDNVRVTKILGSGLLASEVVSGMVFKRSVESNINKVEKCKIAVYTCPIDSAQVRFLDSKCDLARAPLEFLSFFIESSQILFEFLVELIFFL